jgi:hypothetical protein
VRENDEGDRPGRLSAVMRFLAHMRESASEQELVEALIQAAAVWYDLDARAYRRELNGRFVLEAWLPGADMTNAPHELDVLPLLSADGPTHISAIAELEQLGWQSEQGELLLLPIVSGDQVRRLIAVTGVIEREIESTLILVCRSAGTVLDQLEAHRAQEIEARLAARMTAMRGNFQACVRAVIGEYVAVMDAAGARVVVRRQMERPVTLYSTGGEAWATEPIPSIDPGAAEFHMDRMVFGFGLGNEATAVIELLASPDRPFSLGRARTARVGAEVLRTWLSGLSVGASQRGADPRVQQAPASPPFEEAMKEELSRATRLSLSGGVLVASVPGAKIPDPRVMSVIIQTVRGELRSSDLLGQLSTGEIAAVLVRTSAEGVAIAAVRVRQRLDALARQRRVPPVVVGHALYPAGVGGSPVALVARARREAGLLFS